MEGDGTKGLEGFLSASSPASYRMLTVGGAQGLRASKVSFGLIEVLQNSQPSNRSYTLKFASHPKTLHKPGLPTLMAKSLDVAFVVYTPNASARF